jgi:hypothetical protein
MKEELFVVTGGFFDGSSEGYIGKIVLNIHNNEVSLYFEEILISEPPNPNLRVKNKGFSGGSLHGNLLWLCSANQVLGYSLANFELQHVIDDPLFNDLHYVLAEDDGLYVVNTGLESIDYFNYSGELIERKLLTSDERTQQRVSSFPDFRTVESKPHFMHANYCCRGLDGDLLLTFVRQRRVVNSRDWSWVSPEYPASPHEGFIANFSVLNKDCLWVTTVSGEVIASDIVSDEIVANWDLKKKGVPPGWTRGLCILEHGILVGTTKIRASNAKYHSGWGARDIENSRTTISYISFDKAKGVTTVDVLNERNSKIFSILPLTDS